MCVCICDQLTFISLYLMSSSSLSYSSCSICCLDMLSAVLARDHWLPNSSSVCVINFNALMSKHCNIVLLYISNCVPYWQCTIQTIDMHCKCVACFFFYLQHILVKLRILVCRLKCCCNCSGALPLYSLPTLVHLGRIIMFPDLPYQTVMRQVSWSGCSLLGERERADM